MSWTGGLWEALRDTESFFPRGQGEERREGRQGEELVMCGSRFGPFQGTVLNYPQHTQPLSASPAVLLRRLRP